MLFGKLLPREGNFFELFNKHGEAMVAGSRSFQSLLQNYGDTYLREKYAAEVDAAEHAADKVTAEVNRLLHKTFITPIDREQIHGLINAMDDVLDLFQDVCRDAWRCTTCAHITEEVLRLGDLAAKCGERVAHAVTLLGKLQRPQRRRGHCSRPARRSTASSPMPTG